MLLKTLPPQFTLCIVLFHEELYVLTVECFSNEEKNGRNRINLRDAFAFAYIEDYHAFEQFNQVFWIHLHGGRRKE